MELIRGLRHFRPHHAGCVATIGAFDGVHLGHQAVLKTLMEKGRELGLPSTVILFEPLPREFFNPHEAPARLMSFREKFIALRDLGIDRVVRVRFDASFREMGAVDFIRCMFVEGLAAKYLVVGDDLRFGRNRSGDFKLLKSVGQSAGFDVVDTKTLTQDGERVSSTRIREVLADADFEEAEKLLGRPYSIAGRVVVGRQLGRELGAPTANVQLHRLRSPLRGVFAVEVQTPDGEWHKGVANVGSRPTVDDLPQAILEVHLLDFKGDLYRRNIRTVFRQKIRDEIRFSGLDALQQQIARDIESAREYFSKLA